MITVYAEHRYRQLSKRMFELRFSFATVKIDPCISEDNEQIVFRGTRQAA